MTPFPSLFIPRPSLFPRPPGGAICYHGRMPSTWLTRLTLAFMGLLLAALAAAHFLAARSPAEGVPQHAARRPAALADYGGVPPFAFTERSGAEFRSESLAGRPWVASFIFTRCAGTCPMMARAMAGLQESLPPDFAFVSFTVDPGHDTPQKLSSYAEAFGAEEGRWFFLTGEKEKIYDLARRGFFMPAGETPEAAEGEERIPTEDFIHSTRFVLVDARGRLRGFYDGTEEEDVARLADDARRLRREPVSALPAVNASLNATAAALLLAGWFFIRRKNVPAHRFCMAAAFLVSTIFLASYLYYHFHAGSVRFAGTGWVRGLYFSVLISHTVLAVAVPPLALAALWFAWKERFDRHRRVARWALPVWLYVSVTGVAVYWMLYRMPL
jgi:protein SCO1